MGEAGGSRGRVGRRVRTQGFTGCKKRRDGKKESSRVLEKKRGQI